MKYKLIAATLLSLFLVAKADACDECNHWTTVSPPTFVRKNCDNCTLIWRRGDVSIVTLDGWCVLKKTHRGLKKGVRKVGLLLHDNLCPCHYHSRKGLFNPPLLRRILFLPRDR